MWTLKLRYLLGWKSSSLRSSNSAFVQRYTNRLRATSSRAIPPIWGWSSGSPPAMLTTGAPHSSEA